MKMKRVPCAWINGGPRKVLNFKTAEELFKAFCGRGPKTDALPKHNGLLKKEVG